MPDINLIDLIRLGLAAIPDCCLPVFTMPFMHGASTPD